LIAFESSAAQKRETVKDVPARRPVAKKGAAKKLAIAKIAATAPIPVGKKQQGASAKRCQFMPHILFWN
jgi:hypothetical protein